MSKVQDIRKSSLTFAPEAGSQRMRNVINKGPDGGRYSLEGAGQAFEGGWTKVKAVFHARACPQRQKKICGRLQGFPTGSHADIMRSRKTRETGNARLRQALLSLCPSPLHPFSGRPCVPAEEYMRRAAIVKDEFHAAAQPEKPEIQLARRPGYSTGRASWPGATVE